jgi:hypothetical protein
MASGDFARRRLALAALGLAIVVVELRTIETIETGELVARAARYTEA